MILGSITPIMWFGTISRVFSNQNSESFVKTAPLNGTWPKTLSNAEILSVATKIRRLSLTNQSRTFPLCFGSKPLTLTEVIEWGIFLTIVFLSIILLVSHANTFVFPAFAVWSFYSVLLWPFCFCKLRAFDEF